MLTQATYVIKSRAWIAWLIFLLLGVPFLLNHLIEKAKDVTISEKIFQMSEGKFPWYLI